MPSETQVTVRTTEAGRVTEVVVPEGTRYVYMVRDIVKNQIPIAEAHCFPALIAIRQPGGPDVVALAGETLRIAQGRVERVSEK